MFHSPLPLTSTKTQRLWSAMRLHSFTKPVWDFRLKLLELAKTPLNISCADFASPNRKLLAHEMKELPFLNDSLPCYNHQNMIGRFRRRDVFRFNVVAGCCCLLDGCLLLPVLPNCTSLGLPRPAPTPQPFTPATPPTPPPHSFPTFPHVLHLSPLPSASHLHPATIHLQPPTPPPFHPPHPHIHP